MTNQLPEHARKAVMEFIEAIVTTPFTPDIPDNIAEAIAATLAAVFMPSMLSVTVTEREQIACALELAKRYTEQPRISEEGRTAGIRMVETLRDHVVNVAWRRIAELANQNTHH